MLLLCTVSPVWGPVADAGYGKLSLLCAVAAVNSCSALLMCCFGSEHWLVEIALQCLCTEVWSPAASRFAKVAALVKVLPQ